MLLGRPNSWAFFIVAISLLIGTPVFTIFIKLFGEKGETWTHIWDNLLLEYSINSLLLVAMVSALSLAMGISSAWLVASCHFYGRKLLEWLLILPLAIPTYIAAFAYAGLFDFSGDLQKLLSLLHLPFLDIMNIYGLSVVIAFVLYPYIYIVARAAFMLQSQSIIESARILGSSSFNTFFKIALPVARPAIIGGLTLVIMEVLNDYGAVKYYGVSTFTTGIFRAWFSLGDAQSAVRLSALLLCFVLLLIYLERMHRGKALYENKQKSTKPLKKYQLNGFNLFWALLITIIPVLGGFILPMYQLILWSSQTAAKIMDWSFLMMMLNSFGLASLAAFLCVLISVLLIYSVRLNKAILFRSLAKFVTMGYSVPGAVIAIGIMIPFLAVDKFFIRTVDKIFGMDTGLFLSGSIFALTFAYVVRFIAVSYNPLDGGFKKLGADIDEASRSLGAGSWRTLFRIYLPVIRPTIWSAALLVFVDIMKELPLTLILRPFNFHTLATKAYDLASDEMIAESAVPALIIVIVGLVPIFMLNRIIAKGN